MTLRVEIRLLGRFRVRRNGDEVPARGGRLAVGWCGCWVVRRGEHVPGDVLIEALWPDRRPVDPAWNVGVLVARARSALGSRELIVTGPGGYSLSRDERVWGDAEDFGARAGAGRANLQAGRGAQALRAFAGSRSKAVTCAACNRSRITSTPTP